MCWRIPNSRLFALVLPACVALSAFGGEPNLRPVFSRQSRFAVPFHLGVGEPGAPKPKEVVLHVSFDKGATWQAAGRAAPNDRRFAFQAPGDGDYLFFIETVFPNKQSEEPSAEKAGLRVVVDTTPPKLALKTERVTPDELAVNWTAEDRSLSQEKFALEVEFDGSGNWRAVQLDDGSGGPLNLENGDIRLPIPANVRQIRARLKAQDLAGNPSSTHAMANADRRKESSRAEELPAPGRTERMDRALSQGDRGAARMASGPARSQGGAPWSLKRRDGQGGPGVEPESLDAPPTPDFSSDVDSTLEDTSMPAMEAPSLDAPTSESNNESYRDRDTASVYQDDSNGEMEELALPEPDSVRHRRSGAGYSSSPSRFSDSQSAKPYGSSGPTDDGKSAESPTMLASLTANLEFELEAMENQEIERLELWATQDEGRTWKLLAEDRDGESPVRTEFPGEGKYGLRLAPITQTGFSGLPPAPGDTPECSVIVDVTPPHLRFRGAELLLDRANPSLEISWRADDANLDAESLRLSYSASPEGPWTEIAAGAAPDNRYVWELRRDLPARLYLKIEATDQAGNRGSDVSTQPLRLDRLRPRATLKKITPASFGG